jgi:broad specificity phosphatase PhoE
MLNIYFIRHGQSEGNVAQDVIGGVDISNQLTEKGYYQSKLLGYELYKKNIKCDLIFSSPTERTKKTAQTVASILDYTGPIILNPSLTEHDAGDWEGLSASIYQEEYIRRDEWNFRPGTCKEGESMNDVASRMVTIVNDIVEAYSDTPINDVFIFTHSITIETFFVQWFGLPKNIVHKLEVFNTGVTLLRFVNKTCETKLLLREDNKELYSFDLWNNIDHLL